MSIWYCKEHGLAGPATRVTGICDRCGDKMSLAMMQQPVQHDDGFSMQYVPFPETVLRSEMDIQVAQARREAFERAAAIVRARKVPGSDDNFDQWVNRYIDGLATELEQERDK